MKEHWALSNDGTDWIFKNDRVIFLEDYTLIDIFALIFFFGQHHAVIVQIHRSLPLNHIYFWFWCIVAINVIIFFAYIVFYDLSIIKPMNIISSML